MAILNSSVEGYVSNVFNLTGSWFLESVHTVFTNYAW
jgi:hypothetical protein